jgi:hypothetical protein
MHLACDLISAGLQFERDHKVIRPAVLREDKKGDENRQQLCGHGLTG